MTIEIPDEQMVECFERALRNIRLQTTGHTGIPAEAWHAIQDLRNEIHRLQSPWLSRQAAAVYLDRSVRKIDHLAAQGKIIRHHTDSGPLFERDSLDRYVVLGGKTPSKPVTPAAPICVMEPPVLTSEAK